MHRLLRALLVGGIWSIGLSQADGVQRTVIADGFSGTAPVRTQPQISGAGTSAGHSEQCLMTHFKRHPNREWPW